MKSFALYKGCGFIFPGRVMTQRYCDALSYGIRSGLAKKQDNHLKEQENLRLMQDEENNASLLRLFTCFLQSCPQTVIHLTYLLVNINTDRSMGYQTCSVVTALVAIAWALTSYHRTVRAGREDKDKLAVSSSLTMFCWFLFNVLSRVVALSLLSAMFPLWLAALCMAHWIVMSLWLSLGNQQSAQCTSRCEELIFSSALGLAYIFAFISASVGPTRYSYLAYYLVCFIENTAVLVVWCVSGQGAESKALLFGAVGLQITSFLLSIIFMIIYYKFCHPSGTSVVIRKSVSLTGRKSISL